MYEAKEKNTTNIIVYLDDQLISQKDEQIKDIMPRLKKEYMLKDLGKKQYYVDIKNEKSIKKILH